jgi:hypothetical protein
MANFPTIAIGLPFVHSSGLDADAAAFLTAAGITDATITSAINTLVLNLKGMGNLNSSADLWTGNLAIYPMVGGTATTHKFNLKDPQDTEAAYRLAFTGGWTHSSTGAKPNGTTAYANTFLQPSIILNKDDSHYSYYSRTNVNDIQTEIGAVSAGIENGLSLYLNAFYPNFKGALGSYVSVAVADTLGFCLANRKSATNSQAWKRGTKILDTAQTSGVVALSLYLAADRLTAVTQIQYSTKECGFASIGVGFSDANATLYSSIINQFETDLGRNV